MIAGSGFTITRITDIFRDTVSTTSTSLGRLGEAMYEVTMAMDRLVESINELTWIDIWVAFWAYISGLFHRRKHRQERSKRNHVSPVSPTDYG